MLFKAIMFLTGFLMSICVMAQDKLNDKGFDLSNLTIPVEYIRDGGPPRDGIPSIDQPKFIQSSEANFLNDKDRVLGVYYNNIAKAYPVRILNFHEIVNDIFADHPVVITFCPLCGSGIAFNAEIDGSGKTFGVSGLLFNSDVLLYDRETETLWSQILSQGVAGPLAGKELEIIQTFNTSWKDWKESYPNTFVLSIDTGFDRNYSRDPYPEYYSSEKVWFPIQNSNDVMHPKAKILGLEISGTFKAYPIHELKKADKPVHDKVNGKAIVVHFNSKEESGYITDLDDTIIPSTTLFWFAWAAFHPGTEIYKSDN